MIEEANLSLNKFYPTDSLKITDIIEDKSTNEICHQHM